MSSSMAGRDFVAQVRLSNPENATLAQPGETCERVPASSLGWLEEQGLIKRAERPQRRSRRDEDTSMPVIKEEE